MGSSWRARRSDNPLFRGLVFCGKLPAQAWSAPLCAVTVNWGGMAMNPTHIVLAALGAFVAYFVAGGLMFVSMPWMKTEFMKYPAVYRPHEGQMKHMPVA